MPYGKLKPYDQYPTLEAGLQDVYRTKYYAQTPEKYRQAVIEGFERDYAKAIYAKNETHREETKGPDLTARTNAALSQYLTNKIGPTVGAVASAILPSSNAQAMIDLAMLAIPGSEAFELASPVARLALRMGIPAMAGGVGGAVQGGAKGMASGAASGAAQALGGEVLSVATGAGRRAIKNMDFQRVAGWMKRFGIQVKDLPEFDRMFVGGEANRSTQAELDKISSKIASKMKNVPATKVNIHPDVADVVSQTGLPVYNNRMNVKFGDMNKALSTLEDMGWDAHHDPTTSNIGRAARQAAHQIEGEMASQANNIDPKLATQWYTAKANNRITKTLTNLFSEPEVYQKGQPINMGNLQRMITDDSTRGYKMDLIEAAGPTDPNMQKQMSDVLHRGGQQGEQDIAGRGPITHGSLGLHFGVFPRASLQTPTFARHVGYLPFDLGKGRATQVLQNLGPYSFFRGINQMYTLKPDARDKTTEAAPIASPKGTAAASSLPPTSVVPAAPTAPAPSPAATPSAMPTMEIEKPYTPAGTP